MPDSNDFFGSAARSDWSRQPVNAPRYELAGTSARLPAAPGARSRLDHQLPPRTSDYGLRQPPPGNGRRDAPPESAGFGQPGASALDWMELTGAGNTRQHDGPQESTPIFDALVSAWFRKGSSLFSKDRKSGAAAGSGTGADETPSEPASWPSAADQGWEAADAVAQSKPDSYTNSGLPRRTPNARLIPGSMAPASGAAPGRHVERKPEEMRSRLSDFQRGSSEGRHNVSTKRWTPVWDDNEHTSD